MSKLVYALILLSGFLVGVKSYYEPNWDSLDSRPLPDWYDNEKIGIFLHWGVYSVPSFGSEWFWENWKGGYPSIVEFMENNYPPKFTYQDFAPMFTAEFYDPAEWADLFLAAGARYVVPTSKHHEGYTLWPSKHSFSWNSMDVGPNRDLLGDLAAAIREKTPYIHFGLYYSLYEWFNPLYMNDQASNLTSRDFVNNKVRPELFDLVNTFKPDVVWTDGEWEAYDSYWNSTGFLAWLFNESPVKDSVVVNDRWGIDTRCRHGSFYTCTDRYNPGTLQPHKWENCLSVDKGSWGYNRLSNSNDYMTIHELLSTMAETVSCGGNFLVNVGPTHDGRIPPIMEERLRQMGAWLQINGESIYGSTPWTYQNDTLAKGVWYTRSKLEPNIVYAINLHWPEKNQLELACVIDSPQATVNIFGYDQPLMKKQTENGLQIIFPPMNEVGLNTVWVLKLNNISSLPKTKDIPTIRMEQENLSEIEETDKHENLKI